MEVRSRILNGDIQPNSAAVETVVTDVIKHHTRVLGLQPALVSDSVRKQLAEKILEKLHKEGIIQLSHTVNGDAYSLADKWRSDAPVVKSVTGFKQSPEQAANVSKLYQAETAKHEAGEVFNESPTPAIKRQSVAETIGALVGAVKKSGAKTEADIQAAVFDGYSKLFNPADLDDGDLLKVAAKIAKSTPSPAMPLHQRTGATGLHNPVLGTAEEHYPLPLPHAPHARVEELHAPNTQPVLHAPHARVGAEAGRLEVGSIEAYEAADSAKIGSSVGCPQCGTDFVKRNQQHRFCCKEHRFAWHNERDPKRQEFIESRKSKAA